MEPKFSKYLGHCFFFFSHAFIWELLNFLKHANSSENNLCYEMKSNDVIHTISCDIQEDYFIIHFDSIIIFKVVEPYIFYDWVARDGPSVQHNGCYISRYLGKKSLNLNVEENHGQSRGLIGNGPSVCLVKEETSVWFMHLLLPSICDVFILMLWMTIIS